MKNIKIGIFLFVSILFSINLNSQNASDNLHKIFKEYSDYQEQVQKSNNSAWQDLTDSSRLANLEKYQYFNNQIQQISHSILSDEDKINADLFQHIVSDRVYNLDYDTRVLPLNAEGGFITGIVFRARRVALKTEKQHENYLKRLSELPSYIDAQIAMLRKGIEREVVSPKIIVQKCLDLLYLYKNQALESNIFIIPLENVKEESYKVKIENIVVKDINPAYNRLIQFLQNEYMPKAKDKVGISGVPGGKEYYEQRVQYFTTLDMTPEDVFQTGQKEVARIRAEMEETIKASGFEGSFDEFLEFLRTDPQFYAKTPQELLSHAAWLSKKIEGELPRFFGKMTSMPFTVKPVPAAIAPNYTGGRYSGGSLEGHRAGEYWVNTYKLESRPLYVLPALTLHEAVPGHHLQGMLAQELKDLPGFRRTYLSAFGEGWGLYSEYLGIEAGMYETPYENFGRLTYEMWRACRLVVDVGMHYKDWTREEAVDLMASNTALSLHEVNTEIDRYIGWPGQAVSYKIGELKIRELRKKTEKALGDKFDIRAFHDKVLENGSIPLKSLERNVNHYIEESLKKE